MATPMAPAATTTTDTQAVVLKFGGTSVATAAAWRTIARVATERAQQGHRVLVVCSAVAGISDTLIQLVEATRTQGHQAVLDAIRQRHAQLADELGIDITCIDEELQALFRLATGAALLGDTSPSVRARILARGELMSTRLGAAWMTAEGLSATWIDARTLLTSDGRGGPERSFLDAHVVPGSDLRLADRLPAGIAITQGFIARNPEGRTVLLGRGGSDTSAALLAGRLGAPCEIWTDVPGMFTVDPRRVAGARLLKQLTYAEAQEIATTGAKVLHPRAIAPVRQAGVPIHIRCTSRPELTGTSIHAMSDTGPPQVKAISHRTGLVLVTMETLGMWQEVGFLARAFQVFANKGLSIDLVSTSETSVTVSLDPAANPIAAALPSAMEELATFCRPRRIDQCASVSLVGRGIRTILHRLAPVFELFEEQRVHLLSQAASDLNLTVVVDEDQVLRLVERLHATLFAHRSADDVLGPTWEQLFRTDDGDQGPPQPPWWQTHRDALLRTARAGTPVYVTHRDTLTDRADALLGLKNVDTVLYAMKANPHPDILAVFADRGLGFETVSPQELRQARTAHPAAPVLFTPNFAPKQEYIDALADEAVQVTLDNLHPIVEWPEVFAGRDLFVRLDPGKGRGHHEKVRTAGARSKFGVSIDQLPALTRAVEHVGARIVGLHAHAGSGVLDPLAWLDTATFLAEIATELPHVHTLDVGGGLGVPDRPGAPGLDLRALDEAMGRVKAAHPRYRIQMEPGRFLVAEAGVLLARVTQRKQKADIQYVGVDAGMHTLIRPALYGARHGVANLSRPDAPLAGPITLVGPICETGDVLARDRILPQPLEGDVVLIEMAGAYGASMSSNYNQRGAPREEMLN